MKVFSSLTALVLTQIAALTSAAAIERRQEIFPCFWNQTFQFRNVKTHTTHEAPVLISGAQAGPNPAGGAISAGWTYSRSFSWNVGAFAVLGPSWPLSAIEGLTFVTQGGISGGISFTYSEGTAVSVIQNCPPAQAGFPNGAECGLTAAAALFVVEGEVLVDWSTHVTGDNDLVTYVPNGKNPQCVNPKEPITPTGQWVSFSASYPQVNPTSKVNGQDSLVAEFRACSFGGFPNLPTCPGIPCTGTLCPS